MIKAEDNDGVESYVFKVKPKKKVEGFDNYAPVEDFAYTGAAIDRLMDYQKKNKLSVIETKKINQIVAGARKTSKKGKSP